jgi:hypothetical protein
VAVTNPAASTTAEQEMLDMLRITNLTGLGPACDEKAARHEAKYEHEAL